MPAAAKSSPYRGVTLFRPTNKWRAQISANGKTTSLGDHDTEEQAATAFDRAAINKSGKNAKTNFPMERYANEISDLQAMDLVKLVAMLRTKARKTSTQTSHFRGVSLLKQTSRWHAQINVGGKQVHLGFFPTEEYAARAYDRAAINKGAKESCGKLTTNFSITDYTEEFDLLRRVSQDDLVLALSTEMKRKQALAQQKLYARATYVEPLIVVGDKPAQTAQTEEDKAAVEELLQKAERAQPKSTARNPLYQDFGRQKPSGAAPQGDSKAVAARLSQEGTAKDASAAGRKRVDTSGFDRLLFGIKLASLEEGPLLELPLVHPWSGAPAKVAGPAHNYEENDQLCGEKPTVRRLVETAVPQSKIKPTVGVQTRMQAMPEGATTSLPSSGGPLPAANPVAAGPSQGGSSQGPRQKLINVSGILAASPSLLSRDPRPRPVPNLALPASGTVQSLCNLQQLMSSVQSNSSQALHQLMIGPATPPVSPSKPTTRNPAASKREVATRPLKRTRDQLQELQEIDIDARTKQSDQQTAPKMTPPRPKSGHFWPGPASPSTPLPRRRTYLASGPKTADSLQTPSPLPPTSLQELQHHKPADGPRISDKSSGPPTPARPLTKRQEALAIRKTEEAAATLATRLIPEAATRRLPTLPDAVGEALMDFAEAAELAELEDQQMDEAAGCLADTPMHKRFQRGHETSLHEDSDFDLEDLACHRSEEPQDSQEWSGEGESPQRG